MTDLTINEETQAFLEKQLNLILATTRKDGSPQVSPLWYLWKDGEFVIFTTTRTAKWWNLKRDPRCSLCIDAPATGQMIVALGNAKLDDGDVWDRTWELVAKYKKPEDVQDHMDRIFTGAQGVLIIIRPEKIITGNL